MEDDQERSISEVETAFAARFWGTEGGVPSTRTVAWAVLVPFAFVAERVYVTLDDGVTTREPILVETLPIPWLIVTDEAFVVLQLRVLVTPSGTSLGEAVKEDIWGYVLFGVTLFEEEESDETPARLVALTVKVYEMPFARPGTTMGDPVDEAEMLLGEDIAV